MDKEPHCVDKSLEIQRKENQRKYIERLLEIQKESERFYEKNITFISAGALVLSMTFISSKNMSSMSSPSLLISAWVLFALTLVINLLSHLLSGMHIRKTIKEKKMNDKTEDQEEAKKKHKKRNNIIIRINWFTYGSLVLGIFILIIFCSINLL